MCLKNRIAAAAICAFIALFGFFGTGINKVSAVSVGAVPTYSGFSIEQLQKIILDLQTQIHKLVQTIEQKNINCVSEGKTVTANKICCAGLAKQEQTAAACAVATGCTASKFSTCEKQTSTCLKEGETTGDSSKPCCAGLERLREDCPNNGSACKVSFVCRKTTTPICERKLSGSPSDSDKNECAKANGKLICASTCVDGPIGSNVGGCTSECYCECANPACAKEGESFADSNKKCCEGLERSQAPCPNNGTPCVISFSCKRTNTPICERKLSGSPTVAEKEECAKANGNMLCGNGWCSCSCKTATQKTCSQICTENGYAASRCAAWAVGTQYKTTDPVGCNKNEIPFGNNLASDCNTKNLAGGGRACCCSKPAAICAKEGQKCGWTDATKCCEGYACSISAITPTSSVTWGGGSSSSSQVIAPGTCVKKGTTPICERKLSGSPSDSDKNECAKANGKLICASTCVDGPIGSNVGGCTSECYCECNTPVVPICERKLSGSPTATEKDECAKASGTILCGNGWCACSCSTANCTAEGKTNYFGTPACCSGLKNIPNSAMRDDSKCIATNNGAGICARCGNDICGPGENECNCPADCSTTTVCAKEGEAINTSGDKKCCAGLEAYSPCNSEQDCIADSWVCKKPTSMTCSQACKGKGYAAGYCSSWGVTQSAPEICKSGYRNIGWASDCTLSNIDSGGRSCCCAGATPPVIISEMCGKYLGKTVTLTQKETCAKNGGQILCNAVNALCSTSNKSLGIASCGSTTACYCNCRQTNLGGGASTGTDAAIGTSDTTKKSFEKKTVKFSDLIKYNVGCQAGIPTSFACAGAIHGYCRANGFLSGFGPVQVTSAGAEIICVPNEYSNLVHSTFEELAAYNKSCSSATATSEDCISAVNQLCAAKGYSNGFGVVDSFANEVYAICVSGNPVGTFSLAVTDIKKFNSGCSETNLASLPCRQAVKSYCFAKSYLNGLGIANYKDGKVTVLCVRNPTAQAAAATTGTSNTTAAKPATIGTGSTAKPAASTVNYLPVGYFDSANCDSLHGWTCDKNDYSKPLAVHFYANGKSGSGGTFAGSVTANETREQAVANQCGGNTNHGFTLPTPASLKDGKAHVIYAYAINTPEGANPLLSTNGKTITCGGCANDCLSTGYKQCGGNGVQTCGNYDSDACLEWSAVTSCASNQKCTNGVCAAVTGNTSGGTIGISTTAGKKSNGAECTAAAECASGICRLIRNGDGYMWWRTNVKFCLATI